MKTPDIPDNELQRLEALAETGLVNTRREERFDRLTRIAKAAFGAPIALVSLITADRQWFKSIQGLDVRETPKAVSFCGHAVYQDDMLVIPDAARDSRFRDNPLVTGSPNIRFYAGAPLRSREGYPLGTLCVIDRSPRDFSRADRSVLRDLADAVEAQINHAELTELNRKLQSSESRLKSLFELSPIGIALNDLETGAFVDGNEALLAPSGYTQEEFMNLSYWDLTPEEYAGVEAQALKDLASRRAYGPFEKEVFRKDGSRYPVLVQGVVTTDLDGRERIWSLVQDISERKELERIKDEFIATVSHELRTPLTSISGSLRLLSQGVVGELEPQSQRLVDTAYRGTVRLIELVNDLLDIEKLMAGKMPFDIQPHDLDLLIDEALASLEGVAMQRRVQFEWQRRETGCQVYVDEKRFNQALVNILSNAIKFSPEHGCVEVSVESREGYAFVGVRDQGEGIREEFRERIFQRFAQEDSSSKRQYGGTGLGLSITRELMIQMGGDIGFDSTWGEGARFWLDVPLSPGGHRTPDPNPTAAIEGEGSRP